MNQALGTLFFIGYGIACISVTIYLITLAARFVKAHERMADSLNEIASKQLDEPKS